MGKPLLSRTWHPANDASPAALPATTQNPLERQPSGVLHRASVINDPAYAPGARDTDVARPLGRRTAAPAARLDRRSAQRAVLAPGARPHERRWRDAPIILVERRKGPVWQYGSIALCVALWAQVWLMYRA
jgi:hypothetical protein